jgi:hypothetical protein
MGVLPYSLYVRFLITKGVDSNEDVNQRLAELDLPVCPKPAFDRQYNLIQDNLPQPILRQIEVKNYTPDFIKWMKVLEVEDLWRLEKPFRDREVLHYKLAVDINYDPELRLTLNALLMKSKDFNEVHQEICVKFSTLIKQVHIQIYQKLFFNVEIMTRKDWKAYLRRCDGRDQSVLFMAMTEPRATVKALLELPTTVDLSKSLQYLFVHAYQKAKTYLQVDSPDANSEALRWIDATVKLADKYDKHATGDVADFGKTLQMEFEFIESGFMTPDQHTLEELNTEAKERREQEAAAKKEAKSNDA